MKTLACFVMVVAMVLAAQAITWQNRNGRSSRNSGNKTVHVSAKVGENKTPAQRLGFKIESTPDATNLTKKVIGKDAAKASPTKKTTLTLGTSGKESLKTFKTAGDKR